MTSRVVVLFQWNELSPELYEKALNLLQKRDPVGRVIHCVGFLNNGLRVTDVWESVADFDAFAKIHLMPIVSQLGIKGEPSISVFPLYNLLSA